MSAPTIRSYEEFWPEYVRAHSHPTNRLLHAMGTSMFVSTLGIAVATRNRPLLMLSAAMGYGPAWLGHFFVEGNRPATFQHPLWSLRADFEMLYRMLNGTFDAELERATAAAAPAPVEAPRVADDPTLN